MSFLGFDLLASLIPLVALPTILHLLNLRSPLTYPFPSIELIRRSLAQRSKVYKWRHLILLILRTLFLAMLLTAFLQPVLAPLGSDPTNAQGRQILIILDHSLSMEDKGDGPTSRERGIIEARNLIESMGPDDLVNVLLMDGAPSSAFSLFSNKTNDARQFLQRVKPGFGAADVNLVNASANRLLSNSARPEIYYISDFERKKWANTNFSLFPPSVKLYFVDVGPNNRGNRAILNVHPMDGEILSGDVVPLEISIGNYTSEPFHDKVTVAVDNQSSFDQVVDLAPWSEGKVTLSVTVGAPGMHRCVVNLPPDPLEYDNHFSLTLSVQDKEEVLIVTDGPDQRKSGAFYLKTALNPFENQAGSLLPEIISSDELNSTRLAGVQKMFFMQVNPLSPDGSEAVAKFLTRGGGLIYFMDGSSDVENLAILEHLLGPGSMPLHLAKKVIAGNISTDVQQIARGDFKSPYLKLFAGDRRQNLSLLDFYDYYQASKTGVGKILLEFGDKSPAMASVQYGLGNLLLLNFSAGEVSSNLSRQRIFPAWMQSLVKAISITEPAPTSYRALEPIHQEIWRTYILQDLRGPSGQVIPSQHQVSGDLGELTFTPDQLGFYSLGDPPKYVFGVNPVTSQSDLRPIDKELLPKVFSDNHEAHFVSGAKDYAELAKGRPIYYWFVLAGMAFLMFEMAAQLAFRRTA